MLLELPMMNVVTLSAKRTAENHRRKRSAVATPMRAVAAAS